MKKRPIETLTKKIGETFILFLLLFLPFGIFIVGIIILIKKWRKNA